MFHHRNHRHFQFPNRLRGLEIVLPFMLSVCEARAVGRKHRYHSDEDRGSSCGGSSDFR